MRAKFACISVTEMAGGYKTANLNAVYSNVEGENKDFCNSTPSGKLEISISPGTPAIDFLKPGKEYYIDFSVAEPHVQETPKEDTTQA